MLTLLMISVTFSTCMMLMTHPLSMGISLMMQTIMIAMITGIIHSPWYSYILFIIMVGGMLVLFLYMTNVASNEKFKLSKPSLFLLTLTVLTIPISQSFDPLMIHYPMMTHSILYSKIINLSLNKYLNFPMISVSTSILIYLLLTLIAVIKITEIKHGPLRHPN
uniref:NADH-ubiquinone oxidoreductase chain 6 n=1 Tax=Figulus binodulus TaxID=273949 RepID=A0A5J6KFY0_9SCAR|nr:NADH dehydrogenase subunit 6 [Figulus binodulus]QEV84365.1 NADH dehydrogenase subunit 6 [Figulus binodulus]